MNFHGGAWVFPGGRVDDADWAGVADEFEAARVAAAREAHEETGVLVHAHSLVHVSNWTTPDIAPKRFATWFFAGPLGEGSAEAVADGVESDALRWFRPEIDLAPPQFVTLGSLTRFGDVASALTILESEEPFDFQPRIHFGDGFGIAIYAGDVAYTDPDRLDDVAPRHRLTMPREGVWLYEQP
jgi:8-oxo-dGTP pyrophosphatase MutT (NUDIX family)